MVFDRFTWTGLMAVAFGWALLFSSAELSEFIARTIGGASIGSSPANMVGIAQCTIVSGFGIAILGVLRNGFGVVIRSLDPEIARMQGIQSPWRSEPQPSAPMQHAGRRGKIAERGWVKDRAYVLFVDGTVEVETLLGLRRFASLQDAQDFIA
jgi:hypothetical protein